MITNNEIKQLTNIEYKLNDGRDFNRVKYPLNEVVFLTLTAILSGATSWYLIQGFGEDSKEWLKKYFPYSNGIPKHDTINRTISLLKNSVLEGLLLDMSKHFNPEDEGLGRIISIDGKRISRSVTIEQLQKSKSNGGLLNTLVLNAYCHERGICIGQVSENNSGDELNLASNLIENLELKGCLVLGDANFTREKIINALLDKKADYLLSLKKNNPTSYKEIENLFTDMNIDAEKIDTHTTIEKSRKRDEKREIRVMETNRIKGGELATKWANMTCINEVTRTFIRNGKETVNKQYYISSFNLGAEKNLEIIRSHWAIENNLHWVLDVQFKEDSNSSRTKNCAGNLATLRRCAMLILQRDETIKSMKRKVQKFAGKPDYRDHVLR